jgi:hypothetical protein
MGDQGDPLARCQGLLRKADTDHGLVHRQWVGNRLGGDGGFEDAFAGKPACMFRLVGVVGLKASI